MLASHGHSMGGNALSWNNCEHLNWNKLTWKIVKITTLKHDKMKKWIDDNNTITCYLRSKYNV